MTVADKINTLATIRAEQAALLRAEGVTVPDTWDEYPNAFAQIGGDVVGWEDWIIAQMEGLTNLEYAFYGWENLTTVPLFDTSNVTSMTYAFQGCSSLTELPLFDTSNVRLMSSAFYGCSSLVEVPLFDTSRVYAMTAVFRGCSSLVEVPQLDASNATSTMATAFIGCHSLERMQITGIRVQLTISGTQMGAAALNEVFTNMGTPRGSGTNAQIDVRNNPGSATCDPTIAETKGWTVLT